MASQRTLLNYPWTSGDAREKMVNGKNIEDRGEKKRRGGNCSIIKKKYLFTVGGDGSPDLKVLENSALVDVLKI